MPHAALLEAYEKRLNSHRWEEIAPLIDEDAIFIFTEGTHKDNYYPARTIRNRHGV